MTDTYRALHKTNAKYTFLPSAYGIFPTTDCTLSYKTNRNKCIKLI